MGFWDKVNDEFKKAVEEGWEAVREGAKIGKLKYRRHTLHKSAEKRFAEIGGIVYDMTKSPGDNPLARPDVLKLLDDIKKLEAETEAVDREIEATKKKEKV